MSDEDDDSKTEDPTSKRLSKAREDGDVPISQEIRTLFVMLAILAIIAAMAPYVVREHGRILGSFIAHMHEIPMDLEGLRNALLGVLLDIGIVMLAPIGLMMVVSVLGTLGQVGGMWSAKKLQPNLNHLNPINGFKKMFGTQKVVDFLKSLFKVVIIGFVAFSVVIPMYPNPDVLLSQEFSATLKELHWILVSTLFAITAAFGVIAAADMLWTRYQHHKKLKMTKQEVKDEHKQSEGDPMIKGRLRSLRMKRSRDRMLQAVPEASVVVTNPTHYAVALQYDMDKMAAPKLVAKGVDFLASKIRELAEENDIPIIENPPLARALYASVEVNQDIPPDHYKAVAEVIGFVMRQKSKKTWRPNKNKKSSDEDRRGGV